MNNCKDCSRRIKSKKQGSRCAACDLKFKNNHYIIKDGRRLVKSLRGERWFPLVGFEGLYEMSNHLRVKSVFRKNELLKSSYPNFQGYESIGLTDHTGYKSIYLKHRLICEMFVPNPENKPFVNHKNGIRGDNRIKNLEWCTQLENVRHAWASGFCEEMRFRRRGKLSEEAIVDIYTSYDAIPTLCKKIWRIQLYDKYDTK